MEDYKKIVDHYENCFEQYGDTSKGMDWPNESDNMRRCNVMLGLIRKSSKTNPTLLDFGCGTGHLLDYIKSNKLNDLTYAGCDLSTVFIDVAKGKYPECDFYELDILKEPKSLPNFDYIICNGVFTVKRELSFDQMWEYFKKMLSIIYEKANLGISFNVMSKAVDWERDDLFHLSTDLLINFITKNISRDFVIRNDYGLYEYTVYIYKGK